MGRSLSGSWLSCREYPPARSTITGGWASYPPQCATDRTTGYSLDEVERQLRLAISAGPPAEALEDEDEIHPRSPNGADSVARPADQVAVDLVQANRQDQVVSAAEDLPGTSAAYREFPANRCKQTGVASVFGEGHP